MLMAASVVTVLLPGDLFAPLRNLMQTVVAPPQLAARHVTQAATGAVGRVTHRPIAAQTHSRLMQQKRLIENENIALRDQLTRLEATVAELSGLRQRGFPELGRLIPARVVALDAAVGRESIVISKGQSHDVRDNDWVVTGFEVNVGGDHGVQVESAVLARQCLIGWVQRAGSLTSRVALLTDAYAHRPLRVHIASGQGKHELLLADGKLQPFALEGAGGGKMRIRDIPKDLVNDQRVRVGDVVTSEPEDPRLPMMLVVGVIDALELNRSQPVYYNATVRPTCDVRELSQVVIADLSTPPVAPSR